MVELPPVAIGRYLLHRQIADGRMATIHLARRTDEHGRGRGRVVTARRLRPERARDAELVATILDEAMIASRIRHPNLVPVLDAVADGDEVLVIQEYVRGAPLHWLQRATYQRKTQMPLPIAISIACQVLAGLHAAHDALDRLGMPLHVVHREVSPRSVIVADDGTARLLDFGIAKPTPNAHATRRSDVYALAVLLWELVVGHRMHRGAHGNLDLIATILRGQLPPITQALACDREALGPACWDQLVALEQLLGAGLDVDVTERWATAAALAEALHGVIEPASSSEVASWMTSVAHGLIARPERSSAPTAVPQRSVAPPRQLRSRLLGMIGGALVALGVGVVATSSPASQSALAASAPTAAVAAPEAAPPVEPPAPPRAPPPPARAPEVAPARLRPSKPSAARGTVASKRPAAPIAAAAPAAPRDDCDPPYYYDGPKKIFKPSCI